MGNHIGVAVIGAGRAGMIHAENFAKNVPGARLLAVADPAEQTASEAAARLGIGKYYTDYRQLLDDRAINACVIVSPTKFHADTVCALAEAGKHILCEKPMAMTEAECDRMIRACEKNNVKLQIGFMRRFDPAFNKAKEIVESGSIGDVVMVRSNTRGPSIPQPWMYDIRVSNGPLAEVNSHDIDTLRWFAGSEFETVYAIGGNFRSPEAKRDFPDFYDNVVVSARFENGMQGMMDGAQGVGYAYDARTEVLGTKGCVFIGKLQDTEVVACTADTHQGSYPLVSTWRELFRRAYLNEDTAFIDSILNDTQPRVTGHDGKMAVKVVRAGNLSITEKRIVKLNQLEAGHTTRL